MLKVLTLDAYVPCQHHPGEVRLSAQQTYATIGQRPILVEGDPLYKPVQKCAVPSPNKPCSLTIQVTEGYSSFVRISGRPIVLSTLRGQTDGTMLPATFHASTPGQGFVGCKE